ncbi:MAG: class III extradiol dioxygenase subunit B-like domain-containing protein [bacterium]|nr:class III extradiol dioxygenase subunit B-like domain-containing protein [bacterium]
MPFVFATIVPHSPLTVPGISDDKKNQVAATIQALKEIEGELYVMQPDTLFVISPHAPISEEAFSVHISTKFIGNFQEFGDQNTKLEYQCDVEMVSKIREYADSHKGVPVNTLDQNEMDYGTSVALYHLTQHSPNVKIVPISVSLLGSDDHFAFGKLLRHVASRSNKRIAIVASAELSHALEPDGKTFDLKVQEMIYDRKLTEILKLNPDLIENAQVVNGYKALTILFGAIADVGPEPHILSYESPFGVGMMVAQFDIV